MAAGQYGLSRSELQELKRHFDVFDLDGDGHITFLELQRVVKNIGARVSPSGIHELIREVDLNKSNSVEFDEWVRVRFCVRFGGLSR